MKFTDKLEARVKSATGQKVRAAAKARELSPADIIREALGEYFERRETVSHVEQSQPQPEAKAA